MEQRRYRRRELRWINLRETVAWGGLWFLGTLIGIGARVVPVVLGIAIARWIGII